MKRNVGVVLLGALVLIVVSIMFQWRYDELVQDTGFTTRVVKMRTNRFTGTTQTFNQQYGWVTPAFPSITPKDAAPIAVTQAERQPEEPRAIPTPCPTPDPNDPYWHYGRKPCTNGQP